MEITLPENTTSSNAEHPLNVLSPICVTFDPIVTVVILVFPWYPELAFNVVPELTNTLPSEQ